ncbi:MFS transporter [Kineosporia rhizophila]|uniref:MFS transporter n=1 Tax=Kineosporia rhizophila TaxID=84633 RepID=UPI001E5A9885|nr:MFS transporter [Kineosporia rhizophila]MCE0534647.1 MFS transporter [Kineosporia rhizophila]
MSRGASGDMDETAGIRDAAGADGPAADLGSGGSVPGPPASAVLDARAWESPAFRWLLAGRTVVSLGSAIAPVALALAVLHLGGSATELGLVVAAYALVEVLTTLLAGVIGDRFSRTLLMRGSAALSCVAQTFVAVALLADWATVPLLAVMGGVNGALAALAGPSSRAVVAQTVPEAALPNAISALRLSQNTAMVLGFSLAGVLVGFFGAGWAIAVDAATFALAGLCYTAMKVAPLAAAESQSLLDDLGAGAREVFRHTWLWLLISQALIYHLVYGGVQGVVGPIVITRDFGEEAWGLALAALMVGFMAGGVISLRYRPTRLLFAGTTMLALTACFPLAMALDVPLPVILLGAFVHGLGLEIFSVNWDLAIQEQIPPDKLARVFAFDQVGSYVMRPLGLAVVGPVVQATGERTWLLVAAGVMAGSTALALIPPSVRNLRRRQADQVG